VATILVVAKPYEAELVRKACVDAGHEARIVEIRAQPAAWVQEQRPQVVVVSSRLGQTDPARYLGELRAAPGAKHLPVVLIGEAEGVEVERVVARPLDPQELVGAIEAVLLGNPADQRRRIEVKYAQVCEGDYFTLLDLTPEADTAAIERAYGHLRREFEPDRLGAEVAEEYTEQLAEILQVLTEAYRVLSVPELRTAYKEHLT
jgi:DNA-binding response OmpR family regulator